MLSDRELVIWLAEKVHGWKRVSAAPCGCAIFEDNAKHGRLVRTTNCTRAPGIIAGHNFDPLADTREGMADALELEAKVPDADHWNYIMTLREIIAPEEEDPTLKVQWLLRRVTPRQICESIYMVTGGTE